MSLVLTAILACVFLPEAEAASGPGAPIGLSVTGGSQWQSRNGFDLTWTNPIEQGSGIRDAELTMIDLANPAAGTWSQHKPTGIERVNLPHRGEFRAEVRLRDRTDNLGPPASVLVRFDDARPGNVSLEAPPGWISADEFPYEQEIGLAYPGGPSGIAGYAATVSGSQSDRPCASGVCLPGELSLASGADDRVLSIDRLTEGVHWVSAVGVSGAGLASTVPGTERLRVDKTDPVTVVSGVPAGWVRGPVELDVSASDAASGMVAKPDVDDGDPLTVIRAGKDPAHVVRGNKADLTVSQEGITRVRFWARDLAGNSNDGGLAENGEVHDLPGEAIVKIDRRSPVVKLIAERQPEDPELLRAIVRDEGSGVGSGTIGFRMIPTSGEFEELNTTTEGPVLTARLPSDELAPGRYEIRAEATDHAGNRGISTDVEKGLVLDLPVKKPSRVTWRFAGESAAADRIRLESRRPVRITGKVWDATGGLADIPVLIEQDFAPGSPRPRTVEVVRTKGSGRFTMRLAPGPSRTVNVRFAGTRVTQPSVGRELNVRSTDRVRFQVNPALVVNGDMTRMSGRITGIGAPRPAGGKLLAIQYFDPSRDRWRPVEVIRTDPRGRFRYRYRFRTIAYAQKILFRAVSLPEAGWPFETSISPRRPVIVYPSR